MNESPTQAAARGTLLSVLLRLLSFTLTQITLRFVDATTLGRASIRLELLLNTTLFVGREGFRLALTRGRSSSKCSSSGQSLSDDVGGETVKNNVVRNEEIEKARAKNGAVETRSSSNSRKEVEEEERINNVKWLSVPTGIFLSLLALWGHLHSCTVDDSETMAADTDGKTPTRADVDWDYKIAGLSYCLASLIETIAEPLVITCMQTLDVNTRASAEGMATLCKALTAVVLLSNGGGFLALIPEKWPVSAFGMSQLVYSFVFTTTFYNRRWSMIHWPKTVPSHLPLVPNPYKNYSEKSTSFLPRNFDLPTLKLTLIFTLQGIFKHILTEGDRIVLTALSDGYNQGVYAMASSYGGMAARILLQPLEENGRLLFSRQNAIITTSSSQQSLSKKSLSSSTSSGIISHVEELEKSYTILLKFVLYVGLIFASLATNYTSVLLRVLAGQRWGNDMEASATLSAFCIYTSLLALNGTTEAFVYGVAESSEQVGQLGLIHGLVGILFATIAPVMVSKFGTVGLVSANGMTMILRSGYSIHFAARYFSQWYDKNKNNWGHEHEKGDRKAGGQGHESTIEMMISLIRQSVPHPLVLLVFLATFVITRLSKTKLMLEEGRLGLQTGGLSMPWLLAASKHVGVGIVCLVIVIGLAMRLERAFGASLKSMVRKKKD